MKSSLFTPIILIIAFISGCQNSPDPWEQNAASPESTPADTSPPPLLEPDTESASADSWEIPFEPFPRSRDSEIGVFVFHEPQLVSWTDYREVVADLAVEFHPTGASKPIIGSIRLSAKTRNYLSSRVVSIYDRQILSMDFSADSIYTEDIIRRAISRLQRSSQGLVPLDVFLEYVSDEPVKLPEIDLRNDPPVIYCSFEEAILLNFEGPVLYTEIKDTDLEYALNTNWNLLRLKGDGQVYLRIEDSWLTSGSPDGGWSLASSLPSAFGQLPDDENWEEARDSIAGNAPDPGAAIPGVIVSHEPAELILLEGEPVLEPIAGGALMRVTNTESSLFFHEARDAYYYLVSGRWFSSPSLRDGDWQFVTDLPAEFLDIPEDHEAAIVRASIPGTREANLAVREAQIPQTAIVARDKASVEVTYSGEPEFKPTGAEGIEYAANSPQSVIKDGNDYYVCEDAVWFNGASPTGPWEVTAFIPDKVYTIPPESPAYNLTYVRAYDYSPVSVTFGYTYGYYGSYYSYGTVVYGTGWWYDPWYYYPPYWGYPYYYSYPISYGVGAWYNPYTGMYGRGGFAYGPYGSVGRGVAYNPTTGTYIRGRGVSSWYGGSGSAIGYNPSTDTHGFIHRGHDAYASWGQSVLVRDDNWLRTKSYRDGERGAMGFKTSDGNRGLIVGQGDDRMAVVNRDGNMFVGHDGQVFRKGEDGWSQYKDGQWNQMQVPEAYKDKLNNIDRDQLASLQGTRDIDRAAMNRDFGRASNFDYNQLDHLNRASRSRDYGNQRFDNFRQNYGGRAGSLGGARPMLRR